MLMVLTLRLVDTGIPRPYRFISSGTTTARSSLGCENRPKTRTEEVSLAELRVTI
jgi:hypothetical protein